MNTNPPDTSVVSLIRRGLEAEIAIIAEEETKKAVQHANEQIERRIKQLLPRVATGVFNRFTMEQPFGRHELVIRVDISKDETPNSNRQLP